MLASRADNDIIDFIVYYWDGYEAIPITDTSWGDLPVVGVLAIEWKHPNGSRSFTYGTDYYILTKDAYGGADDIEGMGEGVIEGVLISDEDYQQFLNDILS